ncbi:DUF3899 domain-containing protein [Fictibacillus fluitans]|uniref:DUF3899 domain-containing protein n=1 Tax=Fictibacillus fluitans TaxID=3058422 RepID=A0ABT8HSE4_9BACL|nr:DUF3899 domain-containing protein [Fictibacillus sp. NE201]MDN4523666.1 DUF3899 domain-containing protein [Fictibacillus sp. NE201]
MLVRAVHGKMNNTAMNYDGSKSMSRFSVSVLLTAGSVLLSFIIEMVSDKKLHLIHIIDNLFMTGLALVLIGLVLFVVKGGFFDLFSKTVKKVMKSFSKSAEYAESQEEGSNFSLSERISGNFVFPLLCSGALLFVFSSLVAILL